MIASSKAVPTTDTPEDKQPNTNQPAQTTKRPGPLQRIKAKAAKTSAISNGIRTDDTTFISRKLTDIYIENALEAIAMTGLRYAHKDEYGGEQYVGNTLTGNSGTINVTINKQNKAMNGFAYHVARQGGGSGLPQSGRLDELFYHFGLDPDDKEPGLIHQLKIQGQFPKHRPYKGKEALPDEPLNKAIQLLTIDSLETDPKDKVKLWPNKEKYGSNSFIPVSNQFPGIDPIIFRTYTEFGYYYTADVISNDLPIFPSVKKIRFDGFTTEVDTETLELKQYPKKDFRQQQWSETGQANKNHKRTTFSPGYKNGLDKKTHNLLAPYNIENILPKKDNVTTLHILNGEKAVNVALDNKIDAISFIGGEGNMDEKLTPNNAALIVKAANNGQAIIAVQRDNDTVGENGGTINVIFDRLVKAGQDPDKIIFYTYKSSKGSDLVDYIEDGGCPYDLIELIESHIATQNHQRQEQLRLEEEERQQLAAELEEKRVKIPVNPFFQIQIDATIKLRNNYRIYKLKSHQQKVNDILESDFFTDEYKRISELYKDTPYLIKGKINTFKTAIRGVIDCQKVSINGKTPGKACKSKRNCKCNNCNNCVEYLASTRLRYINNVIRVHQTTLAEARELTNEIKILLKELGIEYLTVVCSPSHTGLGLIRVNCLLPEVTNTLVIDNPLVNEARDFINDLDNYFKFLRKVEKQPTTKNHEHIYLITDTGQTFTAVDVYLSRYEDRSVPQETGTKVGFEFNEEAGQIVYKTKIEKKIEKKKEEGIVLSFSSPSVDLDNVPASVVKAAFMETVDELSEHDEKAVFLCNGSNYDIRQVSTQFNEKFRENIKLTGHSQPTHYKEINLTQEEIDNFTSTLTVDIAITPDILTNTYELTDKPTKLKALVKWVRNSILIRNQQKVINAPTKAEFIAMAMENYLGKADVENPELDEPDPAAPF